MYINSKDYDKLEYIGGGTEGIVRKKGSLALKKLNKLNKDMIIRLEPQYQIQSDSFIFPTEKLYFEGLFKNKYVGYVYPYVNGILCRGIYLNNLVEILQYIKKVEIDMSQVTNEGIYINDLYGQNCLFNNGFIFIDTTRYTLIKKPHDKLLNINFVNMNYFFSKLLFSRIDTVEEYKEYIIFLRFISRFPSLQKLHDTLLKPDKVTKFSDFLESFISQLNIQTMDEYKEKLLTLK